MKFISSTNDIRKYLGLKPKKDIKFNPSELIGKNGLNRIMMYKESTQPPSKFDFEY